MKGAFFKYKNALWLWGILVLACRSPQPVVEQPKHGGPTEFHRQPVKYIPIAYLNFNSRGVDDRDHVPWYRSMGFGLGLFIHQEMSWMWTGHKFLYYYIDIDYSREMSGGVYPYRSRGVLSTYPGLYIRTYLPWLFKIHYGGGMLLRLTHTSYDRWGLYGQVGLEFFGFTWSTLFLAHPGQSNWEREYRIGYMYAPIRW
ncbi:MAG: hypothetical protein RML34_09090 [Leptospiraceae bacterium]|nr:hypothetical protein [Leptospiraceae bacterium]